MMHLVLNITINLLVHRRCSNTVFTPHHITTGEGGAILTNKPKLKNNRELAIGEGIVIVYLEKIIHKKRFDWQIGGLPHGYDHKYIYSRIGYNLKSTEMQAALGLSQIEKIDEFIQSRKKILNIY